MVSATPLFPVRPTSADEEQHILLHGVPWAAYVVLRDAIESAVHEEGAFQVFVLRQGRYEPATASAVFPEIDPAELASHAERSDQHAALRDFRDALRRRVEQGC